VIPSPQEEIAFATPEVDATESAATLWAVLEVGSTLPTTPETQTRIEQARSVFNRRLARVGLDQATLERRLKEGPTASVDNSAPPDRGVNRSRSRWLARALKGR
jgi:hypothetical protein